MISLVTDMKYPFMFSAAEIRVIVFKGRSTNFQYLSGLHSDVKHLKHCILGAASQQTAFRRQNDATHTITRFGTENHFPKIYLIIALRMENEDII